jgi:hypothetical protein
VDLCEQNTSMFPFSRGSVSSSECTCGLCGQEIFILVWFYCSCICCFAAISGIAAPPMPGVVGSRSKPQCCTACVLPSSIGTLHLVKYHGPQPTGMNEVHPKKCKYSNHTSTWRHVDKTNLTKIRKRERYCMWSLFWVDLQI